jgi:hypothetical protein
MIASEKNRMQRAEVRAMVRDTISRSPDIVSIVENAGGHTLIFSRTFPTSPYMGDVTPIFSIPPLTIVPLTIACLTVLPFLH